MLYTLRIGIVMVVFTLVAGCVPADGTNVIKNIDQNIASYIDKDTQNNPLFSGEQQQTMAKDYLTHYYSPWEKTYGSRYIESLKEEEKATINYYLSKPGFREHEQPIHKDWVEHIKDKMALDNYPNAGINAITLRNTNIRVLPTNKASYKSQKIPGEGYPFDYLQQSLIPANVPIYVIHQSKNKSWSFIKCHYTVGWVKTSHIAYVDKKFIQKWKTTSYITPTILECCANDKKSKHFLFKIRLGTILPLTKENADSYEVNVADADKNTNYAIIKTSTISKGDATLWPAFPSAKNFSQFIDELMGQPYGWGGLFGYRDCSSTIMDIYAAFGIWIPRNTKQQAKAGQFISFENLNTHEKLKLVSKHAIPFLTLIDIKGHVLLYLGEKNNEHFVLQDVWGLHTGTPFKETGRAIIAKTIISPITLGQGYINIPNSDIERAYGMTNIGVTLAPLHISTKK